MNKKSMLKMLGLSLVTAFAFSSCIASGDGIESEGDPNYWTTSRGQFSSVLDDGTTMYFLYLENSKAAVTFDGSNPLHWSNATSATVSVDTYVGDVVVPETVDDDTHTMEVTAIDEEAFMGCRTMTSCTLPSTIKTIGQGAFTACQKMTTVNIPEGITTIPSACFGNCKVLTPITLPSTVTSVEKMGFYGCNAAASITLNEGLTTIGEMAFYDIYKTTSVTIPSTVKTIGADAFGSRFDGTESLKGYACTYTEFHINAATPPTLEGDLYNTAYLEKASDGKSYGVKPVIYVPAASVDAYKAAPYWKNYDIQAEPTDE